MLFRLRTLPASSSSARRLLRGVSTLTHEPLPPPHDPAAHHSADPWEPPVLAARDNQVDLDAARFARHWDDSAWDAAALRAAQREHVGTTWAPSKSLDDAPHIVRGEGVYLYDAAGRQYLDWTSQAICVNLGHTVPASVVAAVTRQLTDLPHLYSGLGLVEVRSRLAALMAELLPGDLTGLLFPSSGSEANEAAIRIARRYTGRPKVLTQYRSYHGGSTAALGATGDFRRGFVEAYSGGGFVKALNPTPVGFEWGADPEEAAARALAALEETIVLERPDSIAAVLLESIVGSGGTLVAHPDYMRGVRALCDKYGILYIADEVMVGFGRTGRMWGFEHFDGLLPDIVTSAKGLSSAYLPISMVGMRSFLHEHFRHEPTGWGSTYHAHPVALACAYECVKYMLAERVVQHAAAMEPVMAECTAQLVERHPSVRAGRAIGLFGCLDLVGTDGKYMQPLAGPPHPAVGPFKRALSDEGLFGLVRPPLLHTAPPLVISEGELRDGFGRLDRALGVLDEQLGHF